MAALKDQWQAARQVRQAAVVQRRQQVAADLARRQAVRSQEAAVLRQSLEQMTADLQDTTSRWLATVRHDRLTQVPHWRQSLQDYAQGIQLATADQLAMFTEARLAMAEHLRQSLAADYQELQGAVSDLRLNIVQDLQQIQRRVQALAEETRILQDHFRQQQAEVRSQLFPQLDAYVGDLQEAVAATLAQFTLTRQVAAAEAHHQRQQDRQALTDEVNQLFAELGQFRQDLQNFHRQLKTAVWGSEASGKPTAPVISGREESVPGPLAEQPAAPAPVQRRTPPPRGTVSPKSGQSGGRSGPQTISLPPGTQPIAVPGARSRRRRSAAAVTATPETLPSLITPDSRSVSEPQESSLPKVLEAPAPTAAGSLEEAIYNFLHEAHGARLAEIETHLGINRFQAVDALRSLIQKELIVQQDRVYQVHEEALL